MRFRSNNDEYAKERWETLSEEDRARPWPLWANPSTGDWLSLRRSLKSRTALAVQRSERVLSVSRRGTVCRTGEFVRRKGWEASFFRRGIGGNMNWETVSNADRKNRAECALFNGSLFCATVCVALFGFD